MIKRRIIVLWIGLLAATTGVWAASTGESLQRLDESLLHKKDYEVQKQEQIGKLRTQLRQAATDSVRYRISSQLFKEYGSFQYDSAYVYANRCLTLAKAQANQDLILEAQCFRVFCLLSAGLFKEAFDEYESINPAVVSTYYKYYYYSTGARLYYDVCDYNHGQDFQPQYIKKGGEMTDSLLACIGSEAWMKDYYEGMRLMKEYRGKESLPFFQRFLKQPQAADKHLKAVVTSCLGWVCLGEKEEEEAINYLAEAAIYDNETATKETTALCVLGGLLYKRGDVERAVRYVQLALDDANYYNARQRMIQVSEILPIIQQDRYDMLKQQRNLYILAIVIALLFSLFFLGSLLFFRKQNRKLNEARRQLEHSNTLLSDTNQQLSASNQQLSRLNEQLSEANHIKTEYIGKSFYINSEYIKRVEKIYKTIDRKLMARQYEDIRQTIKESTLNAERENMFGAFDETFLKIFPDFVTKFNDMFDESDRKMPDAADTLTPEMRIFALIRLGVADSERIANFLNYSVHTINTYKTRVKKKARVPNDEFEQRIMEI